MPLIKLNEHLAISRLSLNMPFYEARQACKHAKFIEHAITPNPQARKAHQARKVRKARQHVI